MNSAYGANHSENEWFLIARTRLVSRYIIILQPVCYIKNSRLHKGLPLASFALESDAKGGGHALKQHSKPYRRKKKTKKALRQSCVFFGKQLGIAFLRAVLTRLWEILFH